MAFVICMVPAAPMRKEDAHRSEMVSQLLFGEIAEVLEETKVFTKLRCLYDGYEGWCQSSQLSGIEASQVNTNGKELTNNWVTPIEFNGNTMQLSLGSSLGLLQNGKASVDKYSFSYAGKTWNPVEAVITEEALTQRAFQYLNTPYLWGGRSVFGIDCSGFVQQVYHFFNQPLLRDAYLQAGEGEVVGFLQETKCGDLAFFDNEEGRITHVGMLLNADTIIHSSGKVRVDKIDNMGIINSDTGERTHKLRIIKRYF
ncbi:MAG: C40 family peptidase [Bacteroidota bacterium]